MTDSNGRPTEYETVALPTELKGQMHQWKDSNPQPSVLETATLPIELH